MEGERKKTNSELSERIGELAKLEKSSTTLKDDLKTKIDELHTATRKRTLAEGVLVFSAKHTMSTYDELKRQSNPESLKFHGAEIQFAADQLEPIHQFAWEKTG